MQLPKRLSEQLEGKEGPTRQKAARLVVDLARVAKAESFVEVDHAHVSGVSVITGGHGLRTFLKDLSGDDDGTVVIPTTLNSAGCDREKMEEIHHRHKNLTSIPGAMFKGPDLDSVAVEEPSYTFESRNGSLPPPPPYDPNEVEVQLPSTAVHDENPPPY